MNDTLIISGPPRSGTTLFYNLFDAHPQVNSLLTEGFFFEHIYDLGRENIGIYLDAFKMPLDDILAGMRDRDIMPPTHKPLVEDRNLNIPWNEKVYRKEIDTIVPISIERLWSGLVGAHLSALGLQDKKYICMKAPDYGKSAIAALEHIERAKAIIIVRHPLKAFDSLKKIRLKLKHKILTWPSFATIVKEMNEMPSRISKSDPERLRWIRYEDVVSDVKGTMGDIAAWLGISFKNTLVRPTLFGKTWNGYSSYKINRGISTAPLNRSINCLTSAETKYILQHVSTYSDFFSYSE